MNYYLMNYASKSNLISNFRFRKNPICNVFFIKYLEKPAENKKKLLLKIISIFDNGPQDVID